MAIYAIGDIQGCYDPLRRVLDQVKFDPTIDQLWCVGDLVNRGPDSLTTLRYLKSLGGACVCVLGNHDLYLLTRINGGKAYAQDTLDELLAASDADVLIEWLRHLPLLHHDTRLNWCMVHAGLHPHWSLQTAQQRATEVESILQSNDWISFCQRLHHRDFPMTEPDGGDPIFSTAVLTRSRYCSAEGHFDWDNKSADHSSNEHKPWFSHDPLNWRDDCRVVYGHWAARGLVLDQPHVLGLDSGCVWGGKLSIVQLDDDTLSHHSVSCADCG